MRTLRKIVSIALALMMIVLCGSIVYANDAGGGNTTPADDTIRRITFENSVENIVSLDILKTVETTDPSQPAPSVGADGADIREEFDFQLMLTDPKTGELKAVREQEYHLFDQGGEKVKFVTGGTSVTEDYLSNKDKYPRALIEYYYTSTSGHFTLKDGQKASFQNLRPNSGYKVIEAITPEQVAAYYSKLDPVDDAEGTVVEGINEVVFRNQYDPPTTDTPDPGPGTKTTELQVRKRVSVPNGYEMPSDENFEFYLFVNDAPWANKSYDVLKIGDNDNPVSKDNYTGADGSFSLPADTYARFEGLEYSAEYIIYEKKLADWNSVGDDARSQAEIDSLVKPEQISTVDIGDYRSGVATENRNTETFVNIKASFMVSKQVSGGEDFDADFYFELTAPDGSPIQNAKYELYNTVNKNRILDAAGEPVSGATDSKGMFSIKNGQTAMFIGMPIGTRFSITEKKVLLSNAGGKATDVSQYYTQVTPNDRKLDVAADEADYAEREVTASINPYKFVNKFEKPVYVDLELFKFDTDKTTSLPGAEFTISTSEDLTGGTVVQSSRRRDGAKDYYVASARNLMPDTQYYIKETKAPANYVAPEEPILVEFVTDKAEFDRQVISGEKSYRGIKYFLNEKSGENIYIGGQLYTVPADNADGNTIYALTALDPESNAIAQAPVTNQKMYKLPSTGGIGTYLFTIIGVALMAFILLKTYSDRKLKGISKK